MKSNPIIPLRNNRAKKANKMWVSLMATLGISAVVYGIQKFQKEKTPHPIQNLMDKMNNTSTQQIAGIAKSNPIMEFSEEFLAGKMNSSSQKKS